MRILIAANSDMGLYKFRKELITELLKDNEVYISLPNGEFVKEFEQTGCKFIETSFDRHGKNPFRELKLLSTYKRMIKRIKPDVVLTYTIKPNVYAGMACAALKVPYIANITGLGSAVENKGLMQKITLKLYRRGLRKADKVFFQNTENLDFMLKNKVVKHNKHNYALLPGSGVNLDLNNVEDYPTDLPTKYLFVGRLMKDKGYTEYVTAAKKVLESGASAEFYSIGPCEKEYEATLERIDADKYVKWHGEVNNVHEYMKNCHVVVLPSYHEGMANVLLEAAATGRPVIATDVPGCRETYDDGISGLSCKPRDAESLYIAMRKFAEMSFDEKKQMGAAGRKKVESQFDRKIVVDAYMNQIQKLSENKL